MRLLARLRAIASYLARFEFWAVTGMTAASFISVRLLPAAVITAAVFWLLRWIASGRPTRRTPVDGAVLLMMVMVLVTLWATAIPEKTIPQVYRLLTGVAIFYAILNWAKHLKHLQLLLLGISLAGFGLSLFAVFSVEWPNKLPFIPQQLYEKFAILVSDTVNPSVMAGSLVLLLPIPLARLLFAWGKMRWAERFIHGEAVVVMLIFIGLTQSRGSWLALGTVFLALVILRWKRGWLALLPAAAGGLAAIARLGLPRLIEMVFSGSAISSWDGRKEIWSRALYMIQDFPFTGIGMGSFTDVADALYPFFSYSPGTVNHAHNLFLQVAVDLGIPGLLAWLMILLTVIALAWKIYRHGSKQLDLPVASLGAGLLCSQLALAVHGLTDAVTWGMVKPAPLVWVVWGVSVAGWNVLIQDSSENATVESQNGS